MHQGGTDHQKSARGDIPNDKIPSPGHEVSAKVERGPKETDKGQKTDGSLCAAVALDELEIEWYVVDGNEDGRARAGHGDIEQDQGAIKYHFTREEPVLGIGPYAEDLGHCEGNEENCENDNAGNGPAVAPCPYTAAKSAE